ncbi:hypothetical protein [Deinococcus humi]|uniref:PEGA domain-containing protein n=1 Tax=Deinococcus humi TaxID=662880 RepID=A0A7W8JR89_9DEIO|nr:hypothetical protein [Deinococcus humi]MBB5361388.1 hypothetical protein [Deinococcus humi]GGO19821.1 hypothetical protein GCM10008949_04510 [Deinococcus humi]
MKPIGPYVAVQALPPPVTGAAAASSLIRTLRATDRLTGIPVLLHLLPHAQSLPELPVSPHLLPVVDSGMDGEQAYLVTELPLQAHPARDPLLTARGALAALSTLHGQGLSHGGISAAQLWNHDGGVALAGAGLLWRQDATPQADLSDLALALQDMGALPEVLRPLRDHPGSLSAREALVLLDGAPPSAETPQPASDGATEPTPSKPPGLEARGSGVDPAGTGGGEDGSATPHVRVVARYQRQEASGATTMAPSSSEETSGTSMPEKPGGDVRRQEGDAPPTGPRVSPFSNAPAGQPETPQERRKRQNDERREQAMLDSQAAARRKAARLKAQKEEEEREAASAAEQAARGVPVPEPFQMGFVAAPEDGEARPGNDPQARQIERLPASLRRPAEAPLQGTVQRLPGGDAGPTRSPSRNLTPIRIGWDEDDSWRVVRTAPKARPAPPLLRWVPLALALIVLLVLALVWALGAARTSAITAGTASAVSGSKSSPGAVTFTVRGAAGVTARLSVVSAPDGANLSADQNLGVVPGQIRFPVAGTYRLKVLARGYRPATLDLTVPRTQPVTIDLGN